MKKILLIVPMILLCFAMRKANAQELNWLSLTSQTFNEEVSSASVNDVNVLTIGGLFDGTSGEHFAIYDSITHQFLNTMPVPAGVTCQYFWKQTNTWYVGLNESPYAMKWNRVNNEWESFVALDSTVNCFEAYDGKLALGGLFSGHVLLSKPEGGVQNLASGVNADVFTLKTAGDSLLIGMGYGGSGVNALTCWNGTQFVSVGNLTFISVNQIEFHNNLIDVAAIVFFNESLQNRIMRFEDGEWEELMVTNPWAAGALLWDESSSTLLIGGLFTQVYDQTDTLDVSSPIVGYNDDSIVLYPTMYGGAKAITKYNNEIVIVGNFAPTVNGPYYPGVYRLTTDTVTTGGTDAVETENLSGINLFPNPTSDYITVSGLPVEQTDLVIANALGQTVAHYVAMQKATLDVSSFPSGVYLLTTPTGSKRFIKQ